MAVEAALDPRLFPLTAYVWALSRFARDRARDVPRFALGLCAGAGLAYVGAAWIHAGTPEAHLQRASLLFVPLGPLLFAARRESLAALPIPFAIARLGCLGRICCYAGDLGVLLESGGWLAIAVLVQRRPRGTAFWVLGGLWLLRLLLSRLRVEPDPIAAQLIAAAWLLVGVLLVDRLPIAGRGFT